MEIVHSSYRPARKHIVKGVSLKTPLTWLSTDLQEKIRLLFESKYQRILTDQEILDIALNLTNGMEIILKRNYESATVQNA